MLQLQQRVRELEDAANVPVVTPNRLSTGYRAVHENASIASPSANELLSNQGAQPNDMQNSAATHRSQLSASMAPFSPTTPPSASGRLGSTHVDSNSASGMIGALPDEVTNKEYFGGSSAGNFANQIRRVLKTRSNTVPSSNTPTNPARLATVSRSIPLSSHSPTDHVLPLRSKADGLLDIYWNIVHPLYPYLDKMNTIQKYQALWTGHMDSEEDTMFICSLNAIFALSTQLNESIESSQREPSARVFLDRAKGFLHLWNIGSLESVQVFLLLGQYFQSTRDPYQCWTAIGIAIRTAQSLGLHLAETKPGTSVQRRELERKIWHGCVIMDRVTSMTYGRPPMISGALAAAVPRPLAIDEEHLVEEDLQMELIDQPSALDFFLQTLELYEILYEVLVSFDVLSSAEELSFEAKWEKYLGRSRLENSQTPSVLDIERKLVRWQKNLPSHLKMNTTHFDMDRENPFLRQSIILRQRYANFGPQRVQTQFADFRLDIYTLDCSPFDKCWQSTLPQKQATKM